MAMRFRLLCICVLLWVLYLSDCVPAVKSAPVMFKGACAAKDQTKSSIKRTDQQSLINRHNAFRSKIKPWAADMMKLTWSLKLAQAAQAWANQCTFQHHFVSDCGGNTAGQNIFGTWSTSGSPPDMDVNAAMDNWENEKKNYNFNKKSCSTGVCGGFTQLVWARSRQVGCAVARCPKLKIPGFGVKKNGYVVVCNYYPPGNTAAGKLYARGPRCSRCPPNSKCKNDLCVLPPGADAGEATQKQKISVKSTSSQTKTARTVKITKVQQNQDITKTKKAPLWFQGACGMRNPPASLFKASDITKVMTLHNKHRRTTKPSAKNMMKMRWSRKLANVAQAWANKCNFWHNHIHDCDENKVGQNIFAKWEKVPHFPSLNVSEAVENWYAEIKDYRYNPNKCSRVCGHYTQVVWAQSTQVGCGYAKCPKLHMKPSGAKKKADFVVCNYYPAGNLQDEKPFKSGKRCSMCPPKAKCVSGLCVG